MHICLHLILSRTGICVTKWRGLELMIELIGPLYNWLQQFTNHWYAAIFFRLDTPLELFWLPTELNWTELLRCTSVLLPVPSYNSSVRTRRETPSSVVKNVCLLVRYLATDVLLLLRMCLPGRCLAMGMCATICMCPASFPIDCTKFR
jgi:hypothetical protein